MYILSPQKNSGYRDIDFNHVVIVHLAEKSLNPCTAVVYPIIHINQLRKETD